MGWSDPAAEVRAIVQWFSARGLELSLIERPDGGWRAIVTQVDAQSGQAEFTEGLSELEAAQRARRRHSTRRLRGAVGAVGAAAQSEVGQLLIAEVALSRIPLVKRKFPRQAAVAAGVWMLDGSRRRAVRELGSAGADWIGIQARERARPELRRLSESQVVRVGLPVARQIASGGIDRIAQRLSGPDDHDRDGR
jgi:hypothetical protein